MTVLIDSWAWIEYFRGTAQGQKARRYIEGNEEIIVSSANAAEVYAFLLRTQPTKAERLMAFLLKTSFVIPLNPELLLQAAKLKHEKKLGIVDAIVLATAKSQNAKIVTGDADFKNKGNVVYIGE